jgi:hypothetical protein
MPGGIVREFYCPHPDIDLRVCSDCLLDLGKCLADGLVERCDLLSPHRVGTVGKPEKVQLFACYLTVRNWYGIFDDSSPLLL